MPTAEPFESLPFASSGLAGNPHANIYIIVSKDGSKKRVEAASVSDALKQTGIKDAIRIDRFDPLNETLLGLDHFGAPLSAEAPAATSEAPASETPN